MWNQTIAKLKDIIRVEASTGVAGHPTLFVRCYTVPPSEICAAREGLEVDACFITVT